MARDFGEALNSGAHLTALRRTRIGEFKLAEAHELEALMVALTRLSEMEKHVSEEGESIEPG
ncbi:MAG TPA: hypothetical protein DCL86_15770 [Bacteroidales bacterium]|nr:hypothetical protein [Bacteroidales bacterium]